MVGHFSQLHKDIGAVGAQSTGPGHAAKVGHNAVVLLPLKRSHGAQNDFGYFFGQLQQHVRFQPPKHEWCHDLPGLIEQPVVASTDQLFVVAVSGIRVEQSLSIKAEFVS